MRGWPAGVCCCLWGHRHANLGAAPCVRALRAAGQSARERSSMRVRVRRVPRSRNSLSSSKPVNPASATSSVFFGSSSNNERSNARSPVRTPARAHAHGNIEPRCASKTLIICGPHAARTQKHRGPLCPRLLQHNNHRLRDRADRRNPQVRASSAATNQSDENSSRRCVARLLL